jgi:hypothetical protein
VSAHGRRGWQRCRPAAAPVLAQTVCGNAPLPRALPCCAQRCPGDPTLYTLSPGKRPTCGWQHVPLNASLHSGFLYSFKNSRRNSLLNRSPWLRSPVRQQAMSVIMSSATHQAGTCGGIVRAVSRMYRRLSLPRWTSATIDQRHMPLCCAEHAHRHRQDQPSLCVCRRPPRQSAA